jgi:superoxide dismutase, Cu-Zn family
MKMLALSLSLLAATGAVAAPITTAIRGANGQSAGQITLTDAPGGVLLHVEATGLTPGWHGIHFHEKAECGDAGFKASGAHVHMTTPAVHGLLNPAATDMGDLPNIYAGADGKAMAELFSPMVSLRDGTLRANLKDADGSAIIIHAKPDDYTTQPIGGAGDRVACALIK